METNVQPVLRCTQCSKPFDKESSLKRHGYYCRSRRTGPQHRSRSCIACAKSKAKCSSQRPTCSRCTCKGIECQYPTSTSRGKRLKSLHLPIEELLGYQDSVSPLARDSYVPTLQQTTDDSHAPGDQIPLVFPDPQLSNLELELQDWEDPNFNFSDYLIPEKGLDTTRSSFTTSMIQHTPPQHHITQFQEAYLSHTSIPTIDFSTLRTLIQRPKCTANRFTNLVMHALKSYSLMMLQHNTLPPFIHPCLTSSEENKDFEPLSNCISLVHMISSGVQGSRKLFWRNVRIECERLCSEHLTLSKWELLAGMQSLLIYLLIRLSEGETDYNFDYLLLLTVSVLSQQITRMDIACDTPTSVCNYKLGTLTPWKEWIFEESRRRAAIIYRIINLIFYFDPASLCSLQRDLILAPLPARKALWEARDERSWQDEMQRDPEIVDFGMTADGVLVRFEDGQLFCGDRVLRYRGLEGGNGSMSPRRSEAGWEEWCCGMDGLGGLIMLAASLVG